MREMKDSGIEWIGQIPKDWEFPKITHVLDYTHPYPIGDGDHGTIKAENYSEEGIPFIRVQNLGFATELVMNNLVYITEKQNNGIINSTLYPNDILFAKTGATIGKVGFMPENIKKANTTSHVGKITVSEEVVPKFIFYVLSSFIGYKQFWDIALMKSTRPELSIDEIKTLHVLLPKTLVEQQQIADYLDTKCSEIDATAEDIQKEISLLEEYKKSVITEAVTKGLNPDAEMKDSGIEWIGEIPKDWEVHPVYVYFEEGKTKNYRMQEQNLLSLSYGRIIRKDINTNGGLLPASFNTYNVINAGDIIIRPTDLQNDKRSLRTGLVKEQGIITSAYIDLRPKDNVNSAYYHYLLHSYDIIKVFYNMGNGVRQGLNFSEFAKLLLLEPTTVEQQQIADYLDIKCSEIDTLIADKKRQLYILTDYKKSLIYEYITGKKEVPVKDF
ncbi:putative uncharacterized protein [Phascolarctobacterium succinatutens CAG:287]|mgnify:FL=1|uniref:Type I restriction modification DNA specificity domain-containing protein n=1 Tax=Phascolarctobacterium succinatutens CAG:287 TaxID=1263101 RepID=R6X1S6_9FIRM|nr:restriction endonuclease subunit S [Phascolarctobacterium succinatutens]CDD10226.1 putative uncharacterized protein [Phascolarctobacterium succinatutens CAG:287]